MMLKKHLSSKISKLLANGNDFEGNVYMTLLKNQLNINLNLKVI